jgi:hypothetical protein
LVSTDGYSGLNFKTNQNYLTDVGAFFASSSAYGTHDQEGNVSEWVLTNGASVFWPHNTPPAALAGSWRNDNRGPYAQRLDQTLESPTVGFRIASAAVMPTKLISVEQPAGVALMPDSQSYSLPPTIAGSTSAATVWTIRNIGTAALKNITVTKDGEHAADFNLMTPGTNTLASAALTTFSVSFTPTAGGDRSALIRVTSDATNNSSFTIGLVGFGLSEANDTDGDGLNDAAEFSMSALGFNWQSAQPSLVAALYANANRAGLFTQSHLNESRAAGRSEVTESPASYGLYTSNSIMDLRMGGLMLQKNGTNATVVFQPQTTVDLSQPFTNHGTPITNTIPMPGNKGFLRIQAK